MGGDFSNSLEKYYNDIWVFSPGSYTETEGGSAEQGSYEEISRKSNQIDANVLLNADYRFGRDWSLHAAAGWNLNQRTASYLDGSLTGLAVENWPSFGNTSGATPTSASLYQRRRLIGLYGQADLGLARRHLPDPLGPQRLVVHASYRQQFVLLLGRQCLGGPHRPVSFDAQRRFEFPQTPRRLRKNR